MPFRLDCIVRRFVRTPLDCSDYIGWRACGKSSITAGVWDDAMFSSWLLLLCDIIAGNKSPT